ncbi:hypothetical protein [Nakamurella antarctica]|uniref:hypothetical protein n=1 Tax=Nakamurella antarctica TaxID=1902245 RepID=UPI0019CFED74|nr:hypothetical protein [Nakamurella antarctica]
MSIPTILVYSHLREVREEIMFAIGRRPAADLGKVDFLECSSVAEVLMAVDGNKADIAILDAEAQPMGGMGISRQIHNEAAHPPVVILAIARAADRWLATWSKAEEVLVHPLDAVTAAETVARVLRRLPGVVALGAGPTRSALPVAGAAASGKTV